jgi:hypothetical protein
MAAPPSTASPASWNPAVPPPPVTGAAVGYGLYVGVGNGLYVGVTLGLTDSDGVAGGLVLAPALALTEALGLTEPLALGESTETDEEGVEVPGDDVQAESATPASTVVRPQPTAVSRTRCAVRAMAVRPLIEPPRGLGNDHFPAAGCRNRRRKETARPGFGRRPRREEQLHRQNAAHHNGKPRLRPEPAMARPPSEY